MNYLDRFLAQVADQSTDNVVTLGLPVATDLTSSRFSVDCPSLSDNDFPEKSLDYWLLRITHSVNETEVFSILDEFRPFDWTDQERAQMSHRYHRRLEYLTAIAMSG